MKTEDSFSNQLAKQLPLRPFFSSLIWQACPTPGVVLRHISYNNDSMRVLKVEAIYEADRNSNRFPTSHVHLTLNGTRRRGNKNGDSSSLLFFHFQQKKIILFILFFFKKWWSAPLGLVACG